MSNVKNVKDVNHLASETSPYLKQHANNPVEWYPWNREALERARKENKPILLSIGYSACHWCHVMAHESFEDIETAKIMNRFFINIKVDREERPDLDKIYQTAHALLTQQAGGWPLTVFLTPNDLTPFYSGTYFPPEARNQLPSFKEVLFVIADMYKNNQNDIDKQNKELRKVINRQLPTAILVLSYQPIELGLQELDSFFDNVYGGFKGAPKFPQAPKLYFLMKHLPTDHNWFYLTLNQMAKGGIYDQLEGGFFRYAVDEKWEIPHFEKMLYDNGQLLSIYAEAADIFSSTYFACIAKEIAHWATTKMLAPQGGFYSTIDADSEGREGQFYVWQKEEIKNSLNADDFKIAEAMFGLDAPPNFKNNYHLHLSTDKEKQEQALSRIKTQLLKARDKRTAPLIDKKILTAWNALMVKGLLKVYRHLGVDYFDHANKTLTFIQRNLWKDHRLLSSYSKNHDQHPGYLDDYVFLLDALLEALQAHWQTEHLNFALEIADAVLQHYYDSTNGGFYFTANDCEQVLYRPKSMMDDGMVSGNGIAAQSLITLGRLVGDTRYLAAAEKTLQAAWPYLMAYPTAHCTLLNALSDFLKPKKIVIIRGHALQDVIEWKNIASKKAALAFVIPQKITDLPGALAQMVSEGDINAYICEGTKCLAKVSSKKELQAALSKRSSC